MSTPNLPMDCDTFADALGDYLEGDAVGGVRDAVEAHAASCAGCAALLTDFTSISHDAAELPALAPSRDLWTGIADRIAAPVVSLDSARESSRPTAVTPIRRSWARPAVAAAALVLVTAGVTHWATRVSLGGATVQVASTLPVTPSVGLSVGESVGQPELPSVSQSVRQPDDVASTVAPALSPTRPTDPQTDRPAQRQTDRPVARLASAVLPIDPIYSTEIAKLRGIVRERRDQLDPATIAVLEQSISVIDSAIAQSRAALAKDPASGFLASQINQSLEKKVELLRTAALLPART